MDNDASLLKKNWHISFFTRSYLFIFFNKLLRKSVVWLILVAVNWRISLEFKWTIHTTTVPNIKSKIIFCNFLIILFRWVLSTMCESVSYIFWTFNSLHSRCNFYSRITKMTGLGCVHAERDNNLSRIQITLKANGKTWIDTSSRIMAFSVSVKALKRWTFPAKNA